MKLTNGFISWALGIVVCVALGCDAPSVPTPPKPLPPTPLPHFESEPTGSDRIQQAGPEDSSKVVTHWQKSITQFTPSKDAPPPQVGNFGYKPNKVETDKFLQTLDAPTLFQANPDLKEDAPAPTLFRQASQREGEANATRGPPLSAKEPVLLYRALYKVSPGWKVGSQGIGDCVSWGNKHAVDIALAVDKVAGKTAEWFPAATEALYGGARVEGAGRAEGTGGYDDGSYGAAAASWLIKDKGRGGVVYRQNFPEFGYDLTTYSAQRAKQWGNWGCGGQGDKGRLDKVARVHPVGQAALCRNFAEAAAALSNGYPVAVCSGQGFSSTRDDKGFAKAQGSWAHCMCFIGVRFDPPGLLCLNSWGTKWISGPKYPSDQPDGSFWVTEPVSNKMLAGNDSFALSNVKGFPKRRLQHEIGW